MEKKQTGIGGGVKRLRPQTRPPILISENADEFYRLVSQLEQEFESQGPIQEMLVEAIAFTLWDSRRYQRAKPAVINAAFPTAITSLLQQAGVDGDRSQELAAEWFTEASAKEEVSDQLRQLGLGESAIEAAAMCESMAALESFEKMSSTLELRFMAQVASLRQLQERSLNFQSKRRSDRIIEGETVARLPRKASGA
jgi:hypothetical protein